MRFEPVYLSLADSSIGAKGKEELPCDFPVRAFQVAPDVYATARGDCLNVSNLAEDLEFHREL